MKNNKKLVIIVLFVFVTILVGNRLLQEKYCYNYGFAELDRKDIKLGEVSREFKDYSPLQVLSVAGSSDWWSAYLQCNKEFSLSNINFSILQKSYPDYGHFIDW